LATEELLAKALSADPARTMNPHDKSRRADDTGAGEKAGNHTVAYFRGCKFYRLRVDRKRSPVDGYFFLPP
jgi:hypothetical protein